MMLLACALCVMPQRAISVPSVPDASPSSPPITVAEAPRLDTIVPNAPVETLAIDGQVLYVGGGFDLLGRRAGSFAILDPVTGRNVPTRVSIQGIVRAVCSDGAGGWVLAGDFTEPVTGEQHLLRIHGDGTPEGLSAQGLAMGINVLMRHGSTLYLGGRFATLLGQSRAGLAALDLQSNALTPFDPLSVPAFTDLNDVRALELFDGELVVGGDLDLGVSAQGPFLLGVDVASGGIVWQPTLDAPVDALEVDDVRLYVGGRFMSVEQAARSRLAAFDRASRTLESFAPSVDGNVLTLLAHGDALFVGGTFHAVGAAAREGLASFERATGVLRAWAPTPDYLNGVVHEVKQLAPLANGVLVGGRFAQIDGQAARRVALLDVYTGGLLPFAAHVDGDTEPYIASIAEGGGRVALVGRFDLVGDAITPGLAAIDLNTGHLIADFAPRLAIQYAISNRPEVLAIEVRGDTLYAAGRFFLADGLTRQCVTSLDKHTGRVHPAFDAGLWGHPTGMRVRAMQVAGGRVYVVGDFRVTGSPQENLAAFDDQSGALVTSFAPLLNDFGMALGLSPDGLTLYVGGNTMAAGPTQVVRDRLAAFDTSNGALLPWDPGANGNVRALVVLSDRVWVGGSFTQLAGAAHRGLGALDPLTGATLGFSTNLVGPVQGGALAMQVAGGQLFVTGWFATAGPAGSPRTHLAVFDERTAVLSDWTPTCGAESLAIAVGDHNVAVGGAFRTSYYVPRQYLLAFRRSP